MLTVIVYAMVLTFLAIVWTGFYLVFFKKQALPETNIGRHFMKEETDEVDMLPVLKKGHFYVNTSSHERH